MVAITVALSVILAKLATAIWLLTQSINLWRSWSRKAKSQRKSWRKR
jgi:hypothetical protein